MLSRIHGIKLNEISAKKIRWEGVCLIALGLFGIVLPHVVSQAIGIGIGVLMLVSGAISIFYLSRFDEIEYYLWRVASALSVSFVGAVLILFPSVGMATIALLIAVYFIFSGLDKLMSAVSLKEKVFINFLSINGAIDLVFGLIIILNWNSVAPWILGAIVGVSLILNGIWHLLVAKDS